MTQHDPAHRYRAAIIGVGKAGDLTAGRTGSYQIGYTHARSYQENPRIDLVAAADINATNLAAYLSAIRRDRVDLPLEDATTAWPLETLAQLWQGV